MGAYGRRGEACLWGYVEGYRRDGGHRRQEGGRSHGIGRWRDGRPLFCIIEGNLADWIKALITEFMTWLGVPDGEAATILAGLEYLACCSTGYEEYVESNMPRRYSIRYHVQRPHAVFNWRAIPKEKLFVAPICLQCIAWSMSSIQAMALPYPCLPNLSNAFRYLAIPSDAVHYLFPNAETFARLRFWEIPDRWR